MSSETRQRMTSAILIDSEDGDDRDQDDRHMEEIPIASTSASTEDKEEEAKDRTKLERTLRLLKEKLRQWMPASVFHVSMEEQTSAWQRFWFAVDRYRGRFKSNRSLQIQIGLTIGVCIALLVMRWTGASPFWSTDTGSEAYPLPWFCPVHYITQQSSEHDYLMKSMRSKDAELTVSASEIERGWFLYKSLGDVFYNVSLDDLRECMEYHCPASQNCSTSAAYLGVPRIILFVRVSAGSYDYMHDKEFVHQHTEKDTLDQVHFMINPRSNQNTFPPETTGVLKAKYCSPVLCENDGIPVPVDVVIEYDMMDGNGDRERVHYNRLPARIIYLMLREFSG